MRLQHDNNMKSSQLRNDENHFRKNFTQCQQTEKDEMVCIMLVKRK